LNTHTHTSRSAKQTLEIIHRYNNSRSC